ncbi:MAG: hypothetical protein ACHQIK_05985 [Candidatus Acidiferrales bacterium]
MKPMDRKNYILGHHLVAFLDVLGQRERFRELQLPNTPEDHGRVEQVLKDTAGFVSDLRDSFRSQFEAFAAGIATGPLRGQGSVRPRLIGFSDSFVASVPLRNDKEDLIPIVSVFSALFAASILMLISLDSKHALRGGIDVGLATEIAAGEIYGTALERAYLLECQRAKYPRILIGDNLWSYLSAALLEFGKSTMPSTKAAKAIVQKMMGLVSTDTDGERILDYLGPVVAELMNPQEAKKMVQPAYDFILTEQQRLFSTGDAKLSERYGLLRQYFESRLPQHGLHAHPEVGN